MVDATRRCVVSETFIVESRPGFVEVEDVPAVNTYVPCDTYYLTLPLVGLGPLRGLWRLSALISLSISA
jgi:hypothetical protein